MRALWDGQLSTNRLLDDIRGLRGEQTENELLDRFRRVEDMLRNLLDRGMPPSVAPAPVSEEEPPSSPGSSGGSTMSEYQRIIQEYLNNNRPIAPIAQPPPPGIPLAQRLAEILSENIQPGSRRAVGPDPLQPFDYIPAPADRTSSPISRVNIPPLPPMPDLPPIRRTTSQPNPAIYRTRGQRQFRLHRHLNRQRRQSGMNVGDDRRLTFLLLNHLSR